jgi:hypothetical protein
MRTDGFDRHQEFGAKPLFFKEKFLMSRALATAGLCVLSIAVVRGQEQSIDNYAPRTVLPVPVRAITNPKIIKASETEIGGNELVIGVEIDGQARAYPINQLTGPRREIINDELAGTPIAATW